MSKHKVKMRARWVFEFDIYVTQTALGMDRLMQVASSILMYIVYDDDAFSFVQCAFLSLFFYRPRIYRIFRCCISMTQSGLDQYHCYLTRDSDFLSLSKSNDMSLGANLLHDFQLYKFDFYPRQNV